MFCDRYGFDPEDPEAPPRAIKIRLRTGRPRQRSFAILDRKAAVVAAPALHRLWKRQFGDDADLDARIKRALGRKWASAMGGGYGAPMRRPAPSWSLPDLAGRVRQSASLAGKPMVLVFWGGWSEASRAILRSAERWHRRRRALGIRVISMNWELPGPGPISVGLAKRLIASDGYRLPVLLDPQMAVAREHGIRWVPVTLVIDRQGVVVGRAIGPREWDAKEAIDLVRSLVSR